MSGSIPPAFSVNYTPAITGVVGAAARSSKGRTIIATIAYMISGLIGVTATGIFKDLVIWGVIALIFAVVFAISIWKQDYSKTETKESK